MGKIQQIKTTEKMEELASQRLDKPIIVTVSQIYLK